MARSNTVTIAVVALVVGSVVGGGLAAAMLGAGAPGTAGPGASDGDATTDDAPGVDLSGEAAQLVSFDSPQAYSEYVDAGRRLGGGYAGDAPRAQPAVGGDAGGDGGAGGDAAPPPETGTPMRTVTEGDGGGEPSRVGTTNVQVAALDEPDIVKTDGRHFYYANEYRRVYEPEPRRESGMPPEEHRAGSTHVIDAGDPAAPAAVAAIDTTGQLLQSGDSLVVIERDRLVGYDVSDPASPTQTWSHDLESAVVTARERNGTVYLVTRSRADPGVPCPVEPLGGAASIACGDVFHPRTQIQVDATYSVLSLSAASGDVADSVSFVGSGHNTVVYMNSDGLYVTYTKSTREADLLGEFVLTEIEDVPAHVESRIREIRSYDISADSTRREILTTLRDWFATLPDEERFERQEQFETEFRDYVAEHQRNLTRTGIVRIDVDETALSVGPVGTVPGHPLNQFSLDVHEGTLRITTTIPAAGSADSVNDLYTLDADTLTVQGAARGMGENERVYSVRYVGESAYVVTFRRIDPFHVVDLSDPADPRVVGELKLPGFSSYLHPVAEDRILGIGEEEGRVKAVLFDVSDPGNPTIADSRVLDAGWSAVSQTHHAFMQDRRHGVVFLPTGDSGLVLDYTNDSLDVETRVATDAPARRARYVDDMLYVFAGPDVIVLDEETWERTTTLHLDD